MKKLLFILCVFAGVLSAQTNYYSKAAGALNLTTTWGLNADGTGANPANFTTANQIFNVANSNPGAMAANWLVSGAGSKVVVTAGNSFQTTAAIKYTGTVDVNNTGTLTLANSSLPIMGTLGASSTVITAANAGTFLHLANATYGNLTITNENIYLSNGATINGTFTLNKNVIIDAGNALLTVNGLIAAGAGQIYTVASANAFNASFVYTNSASIPFPIGAGACWWKNITVTSPTGHLTTTGTNLGITGTYSSNADLNLTGSTLYLGFTGATSTTFTGTGKIKSPSIINCYATNVGTVYMDQTSTASKTITTLNMQTNSGMTFGNDAIVSGTSTFYDGSILNIGTNTLEFGGFVNLSGAGSTGQVISAASGTMKYASINTSQTIRSQFTYGNLTIQGAKTLFTVTFATTSNVKIAGTLNNTATFTTGKITTTNSTVEFNGAATTIAGTAYTFNNILVSAGSFTAPAVLTTTGSFTNNASSLAGTTMTIGNGLTNTGTFTPSTTTNVTGSITNSGTFNAGTTLTATTTLTNSAGTFTASPTTTITGTVTNNATMTGSNAFNIGGDFTNNSTFTHNNGTVNMNGAAAQAVNGTTANTFYNLSVNTAAVSTRTVTIGGSGSSIVNDLTINGPATSGTLTFATGGLVTILSTAGQTARIAPIANDTRVTLSGNFNIQRYNPGGNTDWTTLASPGATGLDFSQWNNDIYITCPTCPGGSTVGGAAFTSITNYSETTGGVYGNVARYVGINAITDALTHGQGWWVYFGDGNTTTNPITLHVAAPAHKGNKPINLTCTGGASADHGWNLIGNPYASPISWASLWAANASVDNEIQVYNPDLADFAIYSGGVSTPPVAAGGVDDHIPMGQGFYVHTSAATTLTATEATKTSSQNNILKTAKPTETVFRLAIDGGGKNKDEAVLHFNSNATTGWDAEYDAHKRLSPPTSDPKKPRITTLVGNDEYTINALPSLTEDLSIPVMVTTKTTGQYTISAKDIENLPTDACVFLHDNITKTDQDLRKGAYTFTLESTTTTPRFALDIISSNCKMGASTVVVPNNVTIGQDATGSFVKFNYAEQTKATISVTNLLGQKVMNDITADVTGDAIYLDLAAHNNQVLIINVISGNTHSVRKVFNQ